MNQQTIEELQKWFDETDIPEEGDRQYFIGSKRSAPNCLGIYRKSDMVFVYENKDGSRNLLYTGTDEAAAVATLFALIPENVKKLHRDRPRVNLEKSHADGEAATPKINLKKQPENADSPRTIEELQRWYDHSGIQPGSDMQYHIGVRRGGPNCAGIYKMNGTVFVYENKDGNRRLLYNGPDEAHAVDQFLLYLQGKDSFAFAPGEETDRTFAKKDSSLEPQSNPHPYHPQADSSSDSTDDGSEVMWKIIAFIIGLILLTIINGGDIGKAFLAMLD